jgi:sugar lactone lactonase YvrE
MRAVRAKARKRLLWVGVFALLLAVASAAPGLADSPEGSPVETEKQALGGPSFETVENDENAADPEGGATDAEAAALLPHQDLDRTEAVNLFETAFSQELQAPAGPFDELKVVKFLADNVALIAPGQQPDDEGADESAYQGATLIDSTVPLRTENANGESEAVELSLEHVEGELQPSNPLVEVGIPQNLGSGLSLPESRVRIDFTGMTPTVSPSTLAKSVAFYPNVSTDTDVALAPSPTGVETFYLVRSERGELSQKLQFEMPDAMSLIKTKDGGAEVRDGSSVELGVSPPTATDAAGQSVPVNLSVEGSSIELTVAPNSSTQFPILVDPLIQSYNWVEHPREGINGNTYGEGWTSTSWGGSLETHWGTEVPEPSVHANLKPGKTGDYAAWQYTVPRYYQDSLYYPYIAPTSFITHMTLSALHWWANSEQMSPYLKAGLWDTSKKEWVSVVSKEGLKEHGLSDLSHVYPFDNEHTDTNVKIASIGEWMMEDVSSYDAATIEVGAATVELGEASTDIPAIGTIGSPTHWVDQTPEAIPFSIEDTGLGVYSVTLSNEGNSWKTPYGCVGVSGNACPRVWSVPYSKPATYEPNALPTGVDTLKVVAEDPLGHVSKATNTQVKVDHVPPVVSLGGTATEQGTLGTRLASYGVNVSATDGTEANPQSGVAKAVIELDGAIVREVSPGCSTRNCSASLEWTLEAGKYAAGTHTIKAVVTDAVGRTTTKSIQVELHSASPPTLSLAGSMTEQAGLGTSRPRYLLKANASALSGSDGSSPYEIAYSSALGTSGTAAGQFNHPADVAIDAQGNLWVVDKANNRIEEFTESGGSPKAFGSLGSTGGKLSSPSGIVVDPSGNVWVTDTGNTRVVEFGKAGEFLATFGTNVNKTKVEAAGTQAEKNLCTAASKNVCQAGTAGSVEGQMKEPIGIASSSGGNLFVVEKGNGRVEKFSPTGELLAKFGGPGSGSGQLLEPTAVAVAPDASIWVADSGNNRIQHWNSTFTAVSAYGKEGTANGEFKHPDAIEVDPLGNVFVADQGNGRVQEFSENGVFLTRFGSSGTNPGQLSLTDPAGIAANGKGEIWVTDTGNNRVEKWTQQILRSQISTKIMVDGKQVSTTQATCTGESCPLASEWVLESSKYPIGKHTVEVEATDGLGRSTTKTLPIELQSDTTPPTVEASGALFNAPSGWVEQESYGLTASASDAGAGVTSMELKIDGKTVASQAQACLEGGCKESFVKSVNMASYAGGSHAAELVATDGLGHSASKHWTLNVDPEGHVSAAEAEETLEAADTTAGSTVVASAEEAISTEERADGNDPALIEDGSKLESEGVPDLSTISQDPEGGFSVTTPGVSIEVEPTLTSAGATEMGVAAETAAVAANTGVNTDSVLRPTFNGLTAFQSIRDVTAPETFSWNVKLYEGQKLKAIDSKDAEVDFEDGTEAFLVSAELAHDAVGKEVPTTLSVSEGHVITLKVEHRAAQYVYPVVAGAGWEGGFSTQIVETPKDDYELRIEREQREQEELERKLAEIEEAEQAAFGAPGDEPPEGDEIRDKSQYRPVKGTVYTGPPVMVDPVHRKRRSKAEASYCSELSCGTWHTWEVGTWFWNGTAHQVGGYAERGDTTAKCYGTAHPVVDNNLHKIGWSGPNPAPYGYGEHLNLWCNFDIFYLDLEYAVDTYFNMQDHLYGDGFQKQHIKEYEPLIQEN